MVGSSRESKAAAATEALFLICFLLVLLYCWNKKNHHFIWVNIHLEKFVENIKGFILQMVEFYVVIFWVYFCCINNSLISSSDIIHYKSWIQTYCKSNFWLFHQNKVISKIICFKFRILLLHSYCLFMDRLTYVKHFPVVLL